MKAQDREILERLLTAYVKKDARILDVGCGVGEGLGLLKGLGYHNAAGVDISEEMVNTASEGGAEAYTLKQLAGMDAEFDMMLFSHVIEHIEYRDLQAFLESYFARLKSGGKVIILSPVLYDAFFNDIDHIKPYYPAGIVNLFSARRVSRQYGSEYRLKLMDIYFRTSSLQPYNMRSRYLDDSGNRLLFKANTLFFELLRKLSFNLLSRKTGYGALFEVSKRTGREQVSKK